MDEKGIDSVVVLRVVFPGRWIGRRCITDRLREIVDTGCVGIEHSSNVKGISRIVRIGSEETVVSDDIFTDFSISFLLPANLLPFMTGTKILKSPPQE